MSLAKQAVPERPKRRDDEDNIDDERRDASECGILSCRRCGTPACACTDDEIDAGGPGQ